jgi:hypothetical protein
MAELDRGCLDKAVGQHAYANGHGKYSSHEKPAVKQGVRKGKQDNAMNQICEIRFDPGHCSDLMSAGIPI